MTTPAPRPAVVTALCLLACGLLIVVGVRHAQALARLGTFGLRAVDIALFAVLVVLLAGAAALLERAQRVGLSLRAVRAVAAAVAVLLVAVIAGRDADDATFGAPSGGFASAYSSTLFLDFSPQMPWATGAVVVAALGLLPVAGAAAWFRRDGRLRLPTRWRVALLVASAAAAVVLLVHLEISVALLDILRGNAQQLTAVDALTWVAALWSLVAVVWSARALRWDDVPRLAVYVPGGILLGWTLLLVEPPQRHECCFAYAPLEGSLYVPPPVLPDLLVLGGCLVAGVLLPVGLQLLRVRTSPSTPPG